MFSVQAEAGTPSHMFETSDTDFESATSRSFRGSVREWFAVNLPAGWMTAAHQSPTDEAAEIEFLRNWQSRLHQAGWAGLAWPKDYGGRGASLIEQAIFIEERDRCKAPIEIAIIGTQMVGPMLIKHGSEAQKTRYLPRILSGEEVWCQGFSEPNAGSDLAALNTRAKEVDGVWQINGQKVWTSRAHAADLMLLLARTDTEAQPHRGITAFIVPMNSNGLSIRQLKQANGSREFSEVFFDNVIVPQEAMIGATHAGWKVAITTLSVERVATSRAFEMRRLVCDLVRNLREHDWDSAIDGALGDEILKQIFEAHAAGLTFQRYIAEMANSNTVGVESSITKLFTSELGQRITSTAMSSIPGVALKHRVAPWQGGELSWPLEFTNGLKNTIAAGTSQIQRNIIAERLLQLPRQRA
jgi:alkylation response protein AidB-like acyl-CoA dehydrogenase